MFNLIEDRPTPKEVYNWRIYVFATIAAFGATTFGYDASFFGTTLARASFQKAFGFTEMTATQKTNESANITSAFLAAAFFGALFTWPLMESFGRRYVLQATSVIFNVGAILMTVTTGNLKMMYAGRVLTGLGVGSLTAVIPSYISEVSPIAIRGQLTGYFEVAYQVGGLVGFWINYGINQHIDPNSIASFRIPSAVQLIPGGLFCIGTFILTESPAYLFRKGKEAQAIKNLCYLRQLPQDHQYILEEIGMLRARLQDELELAGDRGGMLGYLQGAFRELNESTVRYRVIITWFMFLFQSWSGAVIISYYSPTLFKALGITDTSLYTGVYGIFKATGSIIFCAFIIDRSGRRRPWLISAAGCAFCLFYIAIYVKVANPAAAHVSHSTRMGGNAAIAMVMIYALMWSFGGNGLPWIVGAEIFPIRLRPLTGAYMACCQWLWNFASTQAFPHMVASRMKTWGCFLFFALCCVTTFVFTYFWVPETKAVPIECMDQLFGGRMAHRAFRAKRTFPPNGIPPVPDHLVARQQQYVIEHQGEHKLGHDHVEAV